MIQLLRSLQAGWPIKIALLLVVLSFVYLRSPSNEFAGTGDGVVVQVGDTRVTASEYLRYYNRSRTALQRGAGGQTISGDQLRSELQRRTLRDVLATAALDEFVRRENYTSSEDNLARLLRENRDFQNRSGKFDPAKFDRAAKLARMSEEEFVRLHNASTVRNQVVSGVVTKGMLPAAFRDAVRDYYSEERNFSILRLNADMLGPIASPSESQAKAFYEANLETYSSPEQRRIVLLKADIDELAANAPVSESEIAAAYQDQIAVYRKPERRRVQQIAFSSTSAAEAALEKLRAGARFETLSSGNDIVRVVLNPEPQRKDEFSAPIGQAAFSEEVLSGTRVIDGPYGPTIISVTEVEPPSIRELSEVRREIALELAQQKAADALPGIRDAIEDDRASAVPLEQIASKVGLRVRIVDAVDADGRTPDGQVIRDLPEAAAILSQSFSTNGEAQLGPLELKSGGAIWFDVKTVAQARTAAFENVAERVKRDWMVARQTELLTSRTAEIASRLENGARIEDIARELNAMPTETGFLRRNSRSRSLPAEIIRAGFQGSKNSVAVVDGASAMEKVVIAVSEQRWARSISGELTKRVLSRADSAASRELLNQMIAHLLANYSISYDQEDLARLIDRNRS